MQPITTSAIQPAIPHALPFRVLFQEHAKRNAVKFETQVQVVFAPGTAPSLDGTAEERFGAAVAAQEAAYAALQATDEAVALGVPGAAAQLDGCLHLCRSTDYPLKRLLHKMDASALCLSGGGIRSASFNLGILEGLSRFSHRDATAGGLMSQLDYLSTVSGGGYIGSWMMAWTYRRKQMSALNDWKTSYGEVVNALAGESDVTGGDPEPQPVRHLRSYTSYLAPALGLTVDAFTLAAIVLRNLFVNWIMLIPVMFAVIAFLEWSGLLFLHCQDILSNSWDANIFGSSYATIGRAVESLMGVLFLAAAAASAAALPSHVNAVRFKIFGKRSVAVFLIAVVAGAWLIAILPDHAGRGDPAATEAIAAMIISVISYGLVGLSIWLAYRARVNEHLRMAAVDAGATGKLPALGFWRRKSVVLALIVGAVAVASCATSGLLYVLQEHVFPYLHPWGHPASWLGMHNRHDRLYSVFALPMVVSALMLGASLFCALLGLFEQEEDREWWVRCGGCFLYFNLAWIVSIGIAAYGQDGWHALTVGVSGLALGLAGSLTGYSGATGAGPRPVKSAQLGSVGAFLQKHDLLLPGVSFIAICLIALAVVAAEEFLRLAVFQLHGHPTYGALLLFGVSAGLAVLINFAININLFSLQGMYRMRLMRAFLGASNVARRPDPFTNFDPKDTPYEADLPNAPGVPLHVISTTLNLTGTRNLAWRQRKAESFTFSPVHAGGWRVGYAPTSMYGGSRGVTLATAMSISGAAFNPNMGYHSSPLLSLLMTFFNLRLGSWLPNPKRADSGVEQKDEIFLRKPGPGFALRPLLEEALGKADDSSKWIELTDGGHFENLGLYEMVLRRCKHIIVVDVGADPECTFEDLGNAIRKIRIDLGVPIVFPARMGMHKGMDGPNSYCVVATIDYGCVDHEAGEAADAGLAGKLVYIKAGLTGTEPADILQYAKTHPTFPHESTANQFFNESQFESYRHLGSYVVESIAASAPPLETDGSMNRFRDLAEAEWKRATSTVTTAVKL